MKIKDYLQTENIFLNERLNDKESVLRFIADACVKNKIVKHAEKLYEGLETREQTMSTGVGGGIAFPHTTSSEAKDAAVFLIRLTKPVDFDSLDRRPVDLILALIIPEADRAMHIRILARVSRLCRESEFITAIRTAVKSDKLLKDIEKVEDGICF